MLGDIIRETRIRLGFTQFELSNGLCDRTMLSHIENNRAVPSLYLLSELCNRLGLTISSAVELGQMQNNPDGRWFEHIEGLFAFGDYKLVIDHCKEALRFSWTQHDPRSRARVLYHLARAHHRLGKFADALSLFELALGTHGTSALFRSEQAAYTHGIATTLQSLGRHEEALRQYEMVIPTLDGEKNAALTVLCAYNYARLLRQMRCTEKAKQVALDATFLSRKTSTFAAGGHLESLLGVLYMDEGRVQTANDYFQRALGFYTFIGDTLSAEGVRRNIDSLGLDH